MPMNPPEEFLKHAAECSRMARRAHDPVDKAAWTGMAERWQRCAEWFNSETLTTAHHPAPHHRQHAHRWAHH